MPAVGDVVERGAPARIGRLRRWTRTLRVAWWLGWQVESNWTDPLRFFTYAVARPLGGALILYFMYRVVAGVGRGAAVGFFVIGAAFWPLVVGGMFGMVLGVIGDREHWRTLRYIYTAPISWRAYLIGRALAQQTSSLAAVPITLVFGIFVLQIPISPGTVRPALLTAALALGIVSAIAMGTLVVSAALSISGEAWRMPEAIGAALYLLCGVIFPVQVLPGALRTASEAFPFTWWLEAVRRALLGPGGVRSFPAIGDGAVLARLALLAAAWSVAAILVFGFAERRARRLGILDRESAF